MSRITINPAADRLLADSLLQDAAADPNASGVVGVPHWFLPIRLAWRQLRAEPVRLLAAAAGVMFACVLVLMQLGFRSALYDTATALPQAMQAELFLIHPLTTALFRPEPLPRVRAYQTLAVPEVADAVPIYLAQAAWRNPVTGSHRSIQLVGFDVAAGAVGISGLADLAEKLKRTDTVAFDAWSRPEFGPIGKLLSAGSPVRAQLANHQIDVVGTVTLGPSFGADGNVVMSETNFRRILPQTQAGNPSLIAVRLKPGADPAAVRFRLLQILPGDVSVVTHAELVQWERNYWDNTTPIGFIFAFGSLMGLIVGMVIVYQILFADVSSHLREYATLKAIGFTDFHLSRVVMGAALILALIGFVPGALAANALYGVVGRATYLRMELTDVRCAIVFGLILLMCGIAGLLALRKLRQADPADIF